MHRHLVSADTFSLAYAISGQHQSLAVRLASGEELAMRTPMHRFGKARELAWTAIFLASEAASFVTGEVIAVDGGFLASGVNQ